MGSRVLRKICANLAGLIKLSHRFLQARNRDVKVGTRCLDVGMTKHVLHLVEWPARFKEPTPNLVSQVMKAQIADVGLPTDRLTQVVAGAGTSMRGA